MNIDIIIARGGSKRIPKKNIKPFLGKPIIAYSLEVAISSNLFDRVVVSTDSEDIAKVAKTYGAEVPFIRPKELSGDFTGTNEVAKHTINWFIERGEKVDYACVIYATAPFIRKKYLLEGLRALQNNKVSFAFSVTSYSFPIQRAIRIRDGKVSMLYPQHLKTRSQDLEETYHDAGQFCWGKAQSFLNDDIVFSNISTPVILPSYLVQDIDSIEDWKRAELMYKALKNGPNDRFE